MYLNSKFSDGDIVRDKMFNKEFKKACYESVGDFRVQINRNICTVTIDGKDYPWDPSDMMFYLEDSIKEVVRKRKKSNGLLGKEECPICETSLRKIYMNKRSCDFWGKYYWKDCCYQEKEYPRSSIGKKGLCCRICVKRFLIKNVQLKYEAKIGEVDDCLKLTEKRLTQINSQNNQLDDRIEEIHANIKTQQIKFEKEMKNLETEWSACEEKADLVQMQRNDYHKIAEDFENELNVISRTIDDKKQALLEYQKELNTIQYKYNQRDEWIKELNEMLRQFGKQLMEG